MLKSYSGKPLRVSVRNAERNTGNILGKPLKEIPETILRNAETTSEKSLKELIMRANASETFGWSTGQSRKKKLRQIKEELAG